MNQSVKKLWGYRHIILITLWLLYIINFFDRIAVLTLLPFIQKDFNLTPVELGQLASAFFFAYAIGQVISGFLADKIGAKKTMSIAIIVFTTVTALTGIVKSFGQFIALRIGLGLGEAHHYPPAVKTVQNWFPRAERGRAMSFFATSFNISPAIVPIIVTSMSFYFFGGDWRPVFYVLAIPGVLGVLALWYYVSDSPKQMLEKGRISQEEFDHIQQNQAASENVNTPAKKVTKSIFLKDINYYIYVVMSFCSVSVFWGCTVWLSTFLVQQHGFNIKEMGMLVAVPYLMAIISTLFGGWLMDKYKRMKPIAIVSYLGTIPALWILGSIGKGQTMFLFTMLVATGIFINCASGPMAAYLQNRYPQEVVGSAVGVANGIGQLGAFSAPLVAGYLVTVGANGVQNFSHVFIFFSLIAVVGGICAFLLNERQVEISAKSDRMLQNFVEQIKQ